MSYIDWIRGIVGHHKIFLAFSSLVVRDAQGRVLLQRHTDFDIWGLPGGVLEIGEDILTCAHRELLEETGLTAGQLSLVGVYTEPYYDSVYPNGDQVQQYTICFQGKVSGGEMHPDGVESSALRFFAPGEIPFAELPPWYAAMIRAALGGGAPAFAPPYTTPNTIPQVEDIRAFIGPALFIGVGATAIIVNNAGHLLMVRRTDNKQWSFPGGYMHLGENVAYTVQRETREETGLEIEPKRIMGIYTPTAPWVYPNGDQTQAVVTLFGCRPVGGDLRADQVETSQVAWRTPAEVLALETLPRLVALNRAVVAHLDGGIFIL